MNAAEKEWELIKRSNKYDLKKHENKLKKSQEWLTVNKTI